MLKISSFLFLIFVSLPALAQEKLYTLQGARAEGLFGAAANLLIDFDFDGVADFAVGEVASLISVPQHGAVKIYSGNSGSLLREIESTDGIDFFGAQIKTIADLDQDGVEDLLIGAPGGATGRVDIFSGANGSFIAKISNPLCCTGSFGRAVVSPGDWNGDGVADLVIGAPRNFNLSPTVNEVGRVYIYSGADLSLIEELRGNDFAGQRYGSALAVIGDLNQDSIQDLIVGAEGWGTLAGFVQILSGADRSVLLEIPGSNFNAEHFGRMIDVVGDVNKDGTPDFMVGSGPGVINPDTKAWVLSGSDGALLFTLTSDIAADDFGAAVAGVGDVNGDTYVDFLVGAPLENNLLGSAHLFSGRNGKLMHKFVGEIHYGRFGSAVAKLGDLNNDGFADMFVGVPQTSDLPQLNIGQGIVFRGSEQFQELSLATKQDGILQPYQENILRVNLLGGADYQSIQTALHNAKQGDVILVDPVGVYAGFTLRKGVFIKASSGQFVVEGDVTIKNIDFADGIAGISGMILDDKLLQIENCTGEVVIENSFVHRSTAFLVPGVQVITVLNADNVSIQDLYLQMNPMVIQTTQLSAIKLINSSVRMSDVHIESYNGVDNNFFGDSHGGHGITVQDSKLILANPEILAGRGGTPADCNIFGLDMCPGNGGTALVVQNSQVEILGHETDFISYGLAGARGPNCSCTAVDGLGIQIDAASSVVISRVMLNGGEGGGGSSQRDDRYAQLEVTKDLFFGKEVQMQVTAVEPSNVFYIFSTVGGFADPPGNFIGPDLSALTGDFYAIVPGGPTDANGLDITTWRVDSDYEFVGVPLHLQALVFGSSGTDYISNEVIRVIGSNVIDCNGNGQHDVREIEAGFSPDCNQNLTPDVCDINLGFSLDCNWSNIPDECDIANGFSNDCNTNGIPDECGEDCNGNGLADSCDLTSGFSQDCDANNIPDECDVDDCNNNNRPDSCDIADGITLDNTMDGVPDECQATLLVPSQYPTIQAGIDAAQDWDFVEVADGVYSGVGNFALNFNGKNIVLRSENGPQNCTIDCQILGRAFSFRNAEPRSARVEGFSIMNGSARDGGAIEIFSDSSPVIANCIFSNNDAFGVLPNVGGHGGAINLGDSSVIVRDCVFINNTAGYGGGLQTGSEASGVEIANCTFVGNQAKLYGGGVYNVDAAPDGMSMPTYKNCILWGNTAPTDPSMSVIFQSQPQLLYCNIEGGFPVGAIDLGGNISLDPLFDVDGFHLLLGSPCIDTGDPAFVPAFEEKDIDGQARVLNGRVDIGADEF